MPLVDLKTVLRHAQDHAYAVGSFNITGLDMIEPILDAAMELGSPVILSIAEVHLPYVDLEEACFTAAAKAAKAPVPVVLHLDHGLSFTTIMRAIRFGCTSVMFDGSTLPYEENLRQTQEIVKIAHAAGVSVEAELGHVGGGEGTDEASTADPSLFTDPGQAQDYVSRTGIDALAPAFGTVHGFYRGEPQLDFKRLETIRDLVGVPLVMHGGSGISDQDYRQAIAKGICKVNVFTNFSVAGVQAASKGLGAGRITQLPELFGTVKKAVYETVADKMRVFGSVSQAAKG